MGDLMPVTVRPLPAPTATDRLEAARTQSEMEAEPVRMQKAAENWRTGLAAVLALTLATTAMSSRSDLAELQPEWRAAVIGCALLSVAVGIVGLDRLLRAAYGSPRWERRTSAVPADIADREELRLAARRLRHGRRLSYVAVAFLLAGLSLQRTAPGEEAEPRVAIVDRDGHGLCGRVVSTGNGVVEIEAAGVRSSETIAELRSIKPVATCP